LLISDVVQAIESIAPPSLAEEWDSVGLQVGNAGGTVSGVLLTVDVTEDSLDEAGTHGCDLIVAHHPVIFGSLTALDLGKPVGGLLAGMIRQGVSLYVAHTNLDRAPRHGVAVCLARQLDLKLDHSPDDPPGGLDLPLVADLPTSVELGQYARKVAERLGCPHVRVYSAGRADIQRVALCPGAGGDGIAAAAVQGADVLVTGELKHHEILDARARGLAVITVGHEASEAPVLEPLAEYLRATLSGLKVTVSLERSYRETVVHPGSGGMA
jgi:dinuclear metal center YbgI/SA1388 family protein